MTISGIVKSSLIDYPGSVACVLFVPGCNYDCFYCHNRSLIDGSHEILDAGEIEAFLRKRAGLLDAVVLSGGEPTLQEDLVFFAEKIKKLGYALKLDTNGSSPDTVRLLLREGLLSYCAVDYKAPADRYAELCGPGAKAEEVRATIDLLLDSGIPFEVRTTVIPQLCIEDLEVMAKELPVLPRYVLNRYRKPEKFKACDRDKVERTPYGKEQIAVFAQGLRVWQPKVSAL
jgi:pyruvate formate lyase activating enzyme